MADAPGGDSGGEAVTGSDTTSDNLNSDGSDGKPVSKSSTETNVVFYLHPGSVRVGFEGDPRLEEFLRPGTKIVTFPYDSSSRAALYTLFTALSLLVVTLLSSMFVSVNSIANHKFDLDRRCFVGDTAAIKRTRFLDLIYIAFACACFSFTMVGIFTVLSMGKIFKSYLVFWYRQNYTIVVMYVIGVAYYANDLFEVGVALGNGLVATPFSTAALDLLMSSPYVRDYSQLRLLGRTNLIIFLFNFFVVYGDGMIRGSVCDAKDEQSLAVFIIVNIGFGARMFAFVKMTTFYLRKFRNVYRPMIAFNGSESYTSLLQSDNRSDHVLLSMHPSHVGVAWTGADGTCPEDWQSGQGRVNVTYPYHARETGMGNRLLLIGGSVMAVVAVYAAIGEMIVRTAFIQGDPERRCFVVSQPYAEWTSALTIAFTAIATATLVSLGLAFYTLRLFTATVKYFRFWVRRNIVLVMASIISSVVSAILISPLKGAQAFANTTVATPIVATYLDMISSSPYGQSSKAYRGFLRMGTVSWTTLYLLIHIWETLDRMSCDSSRRELVLWKFILWALLAAARTVYVVKMMTLMLWKTRDILRPAVFTSGDESFTNLIITPLVDDDNDDGTRCDETIRLDSKV